MLNIETVVEEIVAMTEALTSEKKIHVITYSEEKSPRVLADRAKIKQIHSRGTGKYATGETGREIEKEA